MERPINNDLRHNPRLERIAKKFQNSQVITESELRDAVPGDSRTARRKRKTVKQIHAAVRNHTDIETAKASSQTKAQWTDEDLNDFLDKNVIVVLLNNTKLEGELKKGGFSSDGKSQLYVVNKPTQSGFPTTFAFPAKDIKDIYDVELASQVN